MILTVFRSRLRDEGRQAYMELAPKISDIARAMPGYISHKVFVADDGERVTIVEFEDEVSQRAWALQADHAAAKRAGHASFYSEYSLQICQTVRESRFKSS